MLRIGLRLSLRSGREALVRLLLTTVTVAAGVAVLLCVFADYHAFETSNKRPAWESTQGVAVDSATGSTNAAELWYYSNDFYQGQTIERLDVAALGAKAPVPPGVSGLPAAGTYYVSPALESLIKSVPADQLGDRFPGREAGVIGDDALTGPSELVVYVGYSTSELASLQNTILVTQIANGPQTSVWTNYFRYAYGVGALAFMFPILILIGTATRLAAARREQRFAALRLVGATNRQIGVLASVDALVGSLLGTLIGIGAFLSVRPLLADYAIVGAKYFSYTVTPTAPAYVGVLICVPLLSVIAAVLSLRRVRISPLGVSRRTTPPPPSVWRILPLFLGITLYAVGIALTNQKSIGVPLYPGLLVVMVGLVVGGPWLTAQAARLLRMVRGTASAVLASRRLTDNPKAAFRSVSGLVLAVFLGTLIAGLMPAVNGITATPNATALSGVLYDTFSANCLGGCVGEQANAPEQPPQDRMPGLDTQASTALLSELKSRYPDAAVMPIYNAAAPTTSATIVLQPGHPHVSAKSVVPCSGLEQFPSLGVCPAGAAALTTDTSKLGGDNPRYSTQPIVNSASAKVPGGFSGLTLNALLVRPTSATELESIRTFLATHTDASGSAAAPETFGESVQARLNVSNVAQRLFSIAVVLTLLVAGCSLAVAVGGGLVERKRPFALLRLSGTGVGALYRVVLLESVLPLITATVVAGATAYGLAYLAVMKMAPAGTSIPRPSASYYATTGGGLTAAVLVILTVLPILGRITGPENARFE